MAITYVGRFLSDEVYNVGLRTLGRGTLSTGLPHGVTGQPNDPPYYGGIYSPRTAFPFPLPKIKVAAAHWKAKTFKISGTFSFPSEGAPPLIATLNDSELTPFFSTRIQDGDPLTDLGKPEAIDHTYQGGNPIVVDLQWGYSTLATGDDVFYDVNQIHTIFDDLWVSGDGDWWPRVTLSIQDGYGYVFTTNKRDGFEQSAGTMQFMGEEVNLFMNDGVGAEMSATNAVLDISEQYDYT